jgi:hypothetical protein
MRYLMILAFAALAALVATGVSAGARAEHVTIHVNEHIEADFLTEACGVPIVIDVVGDLKVTLIRNKAGLIVRELDRAGGGRITYSSPTASFSFMMISSTWDYGEGAEVGSEVVVSVHGLFGHAPGFIQSDAGLFRYLGVVTGFDEFGIPLVDFVEEIADRGNRESEEDVTAAICDALT